MEKAEIHMISLLSGNELMLGYERDNVGLKKVGSEMGRLAIVWRSFPYLFLALQMCQGATN